MANPSAPVRFEVLQVLRGYASSMVVIVHCVVAWLPLAEADSLSDGLTHALLIPISGRAPVILFFVLSGFVLTHSVVGARVRQSVFTFYVRRLFRIMPIAIVGLPLMIIAAKFARYAVPGWDSQPLSPFIIGALHQARIANLPNGLLIWDNAINPAYWTLHVELVGSALMPLLIWIGLATAGRARLTILAFLTLACLALPFVPVRPTPLSNVTFMTVFCFPLGVLTYFTYRAKVRFHAFHGIIGAVTLIFAHDVIGPTGYLGSRVGNLAALEPVMESTNNLALYLLHLVQAIGAAMLVGALAAIDRPPPFLSSRFAIFIGRISYSLYVIHLPVLMEFVGLLYFAGGETLGIAPISIILLCTVTVYTASLLVAWAGYTAIERPCNELGRRLAGLFRPVIFTTDRREISQPF